MKGEIDGLRRSEGREKIEEKDDDEGGEERHRIIVGDVGREEFWRGIRGEVSFPVFLCLMPSSLYLHSRAFYSISLQSHFRLFISHSVSQKLHSCTSYA